MDWKTPQLRDIKPPERGDARNGFRGACQPAQGRSLPADDSLLRQPGRRGRCPGGSPAEGPSASRTVAGLDGVSRVAGTDCTARLLATEAARGSAAPAAAFDDRGGRT